MTQSVSHTPEPQDSRCRYWAKVITPEQELPFPSDVHGANDIPGPCLRKGEEIELFEGDFFLDGEENNHRNQRGWTYYCGDVQDGDLGLSDSRYKHPDVKAFLRERGEKELLRGSGDVAAIVRYIHAVRLGYRAWVAARRETS